MGGDLARNERLIYLNRGEEIRFEKSTNGSLIKVCSILLVLFFLISVALSHVLIAPREVPDGSGTPDQFKIYAYTSHSTIRINNDSEFGTIAATESWSGNGTAAQPYAIEGYRINATGNESAIYIGNTTVYFVIQNCLLFNASSSCIHLYDVDRGNVTGNSCSNSTYGILLSYSSGTVVGNNSCNGNQYGLGIFQSLGRNEVANNTALNNSECGIQLQSDSDLIYGNDCSGSEDGIWLDWNSWGNEIRNNSCHHNTVHGIYLYWGGSYNLIDGNNCSFNQIGVEIYYPSTSPPEGNIISNNTFQSNSNKGVILFQGNRYIVENNTFRSSGTGLISAYMISHCRIDTNRFLSGGLAIEIQDADNVSMVGNNCSGCTLGFALYSVENATMKENEFNGSGLYISGFSLRFWNTHMIDTSNLVNGKPIYYFKNQTGGGVPGNAGEVILGNCSGMSVQSLSFNRVYLAVELGFSHENLVGNCSFNGSLVDIYLQFSDNNTISDNQCLHDAAYGIFAYYSDGNHFLRNDWIDGYYSITLRYSENNTLASNNCSGNRDGVYLEQSHFNTITDNVFGLNTYNGIYLYFSSNNSVSQNLIYDNGRFGVKIEGYGRSTDNMIWNNSFYRNNGATTTFDPSHIQGYDSSGDNDWNNTGGYGNWWSDWQNRDFNADGIQDAPYNISGSADTKDFFPLASIPAPIPEFTDLFVPLLVTVGVIFGLRSRRIRR